MSDEKATRFVMKNIKPYGHTISVKGFSVDPNIAVNFLVANEEGSIGYHFNPRYDIKAIFLNSCKYGRWLPEREVKRKGDFFKWQRGSFVEFKFMVEREGIRCFWQGEELKDCFFPHRINPASYSGLEILGMKTRKVEVTKNVSAVADQETNIEIDDLSLVGKTLTLKGKARIPRPAVNFLVNNDKGNYALHFNPRFDEKMLVRNSKLNGRWQERQLGLFRQIVWNMAEDLQISIMVTNDRFYCIWNDSVVCRFEHRVPVADLIGLCVNGFTVRSIAIE